jgi:hypothetical protein
MLEERAFAGNMNIHRIKYKEKWESMVRRNEMT